MRDGTHRLEEIGFTGAGEFQQHIAVLLHLLAALAQVFLGALVFGVVNDAGAHQGATFVGQAACEADFRRDHAARTVLMQPLKNGGPPVVAWLIQSRAASDEQRPSG